MKLLDRRAYSSGELAGRLESTGYDPDLVREAVERLVSLGLVDDEAYARSLARAATAGGPMAAELLRRKLEARRVPPEIAQRVARESALGVDPVEAAAGLATRLGRRIGRAGPEVARRRIAGALSRRGFDADIIVAALHRAGFEEPQP